MKRIEAVSGLLACGVAAGFLAKDNSIVVAAVSAPLAAAFAFAVTTGRKGFLLPAVFFAGMMLASASALLPVGGPGLLEPLAEALRVRIDSMDFAHIWTAPLLKALLTGDRSGLDSGLKATFRESGASHLLALSGLHVGILYLFLGKLTAPIGNSPRGKTVRSAIAVAAALVFTLSTGGNPSMVRAFLFILAREFATLTHRSRDPGKILSFALTVQLVLSPQVIATIGFQLSYLATFGIVTLFPIMEKWFPGGRFNPLKRIWDAAALTIACQIFTAPLVWFRFHSFPRHFLLTNIMAIPVTTAALAVSVVALAFPNPFTVTAADWLITLLVNILTIIATM